MMLDFLGEVSAAQRIEKAIGDLLSSGQVPSADAKSGISTSDMGDMVVQRVRGD
jgi:3-isopropylmalate dehydrogenase